MEDGSLVAQGAIEDGYIDGYVSDPEWAARLKTWRQLNKLGRFDDLARQAGVSVKVIEDAARYGNYDDKCEDTDWGSIQAAINVLTGRTKRQTKLKRARQKAGERKENHRSKRKVITLLNEIQTADFVVFPTDIETDVGYDNTPVFDEIDARVLRRELRKSAETYNKYMSAFTSLTNSGLCGSTASHTKLNRPGFLPSCKNPNPAFQSFCDHNPLHSSG